MDAFAASEAIEDLDVSSEEDLLTLTAHELLMRHACSASKADILPVRPVLVVPPKSRIH